MKRVERSTRRREEKKKSLLSRLSDHIVFDVIMPVLHSERVCVDLRDYDLRQVVEHFGDISSSTAWQVSA